MKSTPPKSLTKGFMAKFAMRIKNSHFFNDRLFISLLLSAVIINVATLLWLAFQVRPNDVPVPIRFSSLLSGFYQLGPWYFPFVIGVYAIFITALNGFFAYQSFNRSRMVSFFLLVSSNVVGAFAFAISTAFGAIR